MLASCRWKGISVEGFELWPSLVERHQRAATDPDWLTVLIIAQTKGVRDGAGLLDVAKPLRQVATLITDDDDGRRRHLRRRPVIVSKVWRHHRRQTEIGRASCRERV